MPAKLKSRKGKRHHVHAASFERMAENLASSSTCNFPLYKDDIVALFKAEAKYLRSIVR